MHMDYSLVQKEYIVKWDSGRICKYIGLDFQDAMFSNGFDYWYIREKANYDILKVNVI